ncbi:MAG: hypothetical protein J6B79_02460 [Clostridia bacterium]|nr:hypothetical protein [Clostridia bacterium]
MASFTSKFNEITDNAYDYLVLKSVDVDVKTESVVITVIFPELKEKEVRENESKISSAVIRALGLKSSVTVKLVKSHFDEDLFKKALINFAEGSPSVAPFVFAEDVVIQKLGEYAYDVKLKIDADMVNNPVFSKFTDDVKKMLNVSYCEDINFEIIPQVRAKKIDIIAEHEEELRNYVYQTSDGHFITPHNVEEFIGKIIYDRAGYISDAKREATGVTYCGKVSEFTECDRKPKEGESAGKKFYKFTITDPTGSMKCLYFPRKSDKENNIVHLKDGKEVVVKGSIKENTFRGNTTYDMFVNSISLCTIPEVEIKQAPKFKTKREYKTVFPQQYVEQHQASLFDVAKAVPEYLKNKRFCVFDLETTGLDTTTCKIIEVAGVLVEDGHLTQVFNSFVNPHEPITQRITDLTSITDSDVVNAPEIEDVLADFYKFSENTVFVGHNVNFDVGFLNASGKELGIYFDNHKEDTLEIARHTLKGLRNFKLSTVLKHLGLVNEHAHRAIHDTIATAKAFIKMAEML